MDRHEISWTPEQLAAYRERKARNRHCPRCGAGCGQVLLEVLADRPDVVTICEACGPIQRKAV